MHESGHVMLTDFDLSKQSVTPVSVKMVSKFMSSKQQLEVQPQLVTNSFVGTEEYIAPEVIDGTGHNSTVDWWTLGILIFEMLYGKSPFRGRDRKETFENIQASTARGLRFPDEPDTSREAKHLLKGLLHTNPKKRLGAEHGASDIKEHPWFKPVNWALIRNQTPPMVPKLSHALDTRYFRTIRDDDTAGQADERGVDSEQLEQDDPFREFKSVTRGPNPKEADQSNVSSSSPSSAASSSSSSSSSSAVPSKKIVSTVPAAVEFLSSSSSSSKKKSRESKSSRDSRSSRSSSSSSSSSSLSTSKRRKKKKSSSSKKLKDSTKADEESTKD
jgi:serine/threonine protein kinase